jgi:hypothetical protein
MQAVRGTDKTVAFKSTTSAISTTVHDRFRTALPSIFRLSCRNLLRLRAHKNPFLLTVLQLDDSELQNLYLILAFPIAKAVSFSGFRTSFRIPILPL